MTDAEIFAGDSYTLTFTVTQDGEPVDLSGATLRWALSPSVYKDPEIIKTSDDDSLSLGDEDGEVIVELSPSETTGLGAPTTMHHELEVSDDENVATAATGSIEIKPVVLEPEDTE